MLVTEMTLYGYKNQIKLVYHSNASLVMLPYYFTQPAYALLIIVSYRYNWINLIQLKFNSS